ncbi:MAG TPA: response regulator [Tepidisphaeraceae bacterium]|nr:response regulator [Tepidisphaeraceae bacterium]
MSLKGSRPRLLLVEDDRATYTALRGILNLRGWDVRVATSISDARDALAERVDAVILDLMLPDGAGEGLIADVRGRFPGIPLAITTGLGDGERIDAVERMGVTAVLRKPITLAELLKVIGGA